MVYVCFEFAFQTTRFRVGKRGVLGLLLMMVYDSYEFAFQSTRFRVV
jgi:hypothetical protein